MPSGSAATAALIERGPVRDRRVRLPRERAVPADRGGVEGGAQLHGRRGRAAVVDVGQAEERLRVPDAGRVQDRGQLRGQPGVEVGVQDHREETEAVEALRRRRPGRLEHLPLERLRCELVRDHRDVGGEVRRRRSAAAVGAERGQRRRERPQDVGAERVRQLGRKDGIEQQPLDVGGVRERVGHRQLRPVRDAEERDLVDSERCPDGLEVLRVLGRAVELARRADDVRADGCRGALLVRGERHLERGAVEEPRLAGAAVVVGDERVPREEELEERGGRRRAEAEDVRRPLARAARDQEHRPRAGYPAPAAPRRAATTVPATAPVRSSGTSTCEQRSPGVSPHGVAAEPPVRRRPPAPLSPSAREGSALETRSDCRPAAGTRAGGPAAVPDADPRATTGRKTIAASSARAVRPVPRFLISPLATGKQL